MTDGKNMTIISGEDLASKTPIKIGFALNINIDFANVVETLSKLENSIQTLQNSISNVIPQGENKFIQIDWDGTNSNDTKNSMNPICCDTESKNKFDGGGSKQISERQKDTIRSMCENREYDPEKYSIDCIGKKLDELCGSEANRLIKRLKGAKNE